VAVRRAEGREGLVDVPFTIDVRVTRRYAFYRACVRAVLRVMWTPRYIGLERVPGHGPVILAPVHRSLIDFAFATALTDRKLFFMAKDDLWRSRALGRVLTHLGAFPVRRESADRLSLQRAQEILELGQVLVVFPEGGRFEGPRVADLMEGTAFLAARTGASVVPVGIAGSDHALAKGARLPRRTPVTVVVGAPLAPAARRENGRVSRSALSAATEELHEALQDAYDDARRRRATES
jgi:1-acyl-sn-glycerol-3-phosphate acyltransferase